jgi:hypothetical protein
MIADPEYYSQFKSLSLASDQLDLTAKYAILEALYAEARQLGKFGKEDLFLGLEDTVRLAAALNGTLPRSSC